MSQELAYLESMQKELLAYSEKVAELPRPDPTLGEHLLALLTELSKIEAELREAHQVGARFIVLQNQISLLLQQCHDTFPAAQVLPEIEDRRLMAEDESMLFIYVFNMNGEKAKNWQKLLTVSALRDHGVNRPIYTAREDVEELLRSKPDPALHAYLEVIVKKTDILPSTAKDIQGHTLVRLKEDRLTPQSVHHFVHLGRHYRLVNELGELTT